MQTVNQFDFKNLPKLYKKQELIQNFMLNTEAHKL